MSINANHLPQTHVSADVIQGTPSGPTSASTDSVALSGPLSGATEAVAGCHRGGSRQRSGQRAGRSRESHPSAVMSFNANNMTQTPVTTTAPLPSLPLNDASTPFAQRDYVDPTTSVTGKHGGQHTRIRADKWHEPQQLKKTNPRAYRKKTKRLRHKDNRDKRIKAAHQAAASDAAAADTANAQPAWAAEDAEGDEMQLDEEEEEDDLEEFDMDLDEDLDEPEPQMEQEQSGYVYGGKSGGSLRRVREASFREPSFASD